MDVLGQLAQSMAEAGVAGRSHAKVHLTGIHLQGLKATQSDIIVHELRPLMDASSLADMTIMAERARRAYEGMGIFKSVQITLESDDGAKGSGPSEGSTPTSVHVHVKEGNRITLETGTTVGNDEGTWSATGNVKNLFGRAESLRLSASVGTRTHTAFEGTFRKPFLFGRPEVLELSVFKALHRDIVHSSHEEKERGLKLALSTATFLRSGHIASGSLTYTASWREILLADGVSYTVRRDAGHSLKSSLTARGMIDSRDFAPMPSSGSAVEATLEAAGLGGDVRFLKGHLSAQTSWTGPGAITFSASANTGLLVSLDPSGSRINDRFFLGGPSTLRGFRTKTVGPVDGKDCVGGDLLAAGFVNAVVPLWPRPVDGVPVLSSGGFALRAHVFAQAGHLVSLTSSGDWKRDVSLGIEALSAEPRSSYGVGAVISVGVGRVEINYCWPHSFGATDHTKAGLQIGFGTSFW